MNEEEIPFLHRALLLLQLLQKLRQPPVLKLRRLLKVVILLGAFDLVFDLLNLTTQLLNPLHGRLFVLPLGFLRRKRIFQLRQLLLQICKPLARETVGFLFQCGFLDLELHHTTVQLVKLRRHGVQLGLDQGTRLVHEVNRLVRQKTVADIAVGQDSRGDKRAVSDLHAVEHLIALL